MKYFKLIALQSMIFLFCWVGFSTGHAASDKKAVNAPLHANKTASPIYAKGLLWKIQKAGAKPSYIFGTVHLDDERVTRLPDPVAAAFAESEAFAMEMLLDTDNQQQLALAMIYMDGRNLQTILGDGLFARVLPLLAIRGVPREVAMQLKPWAVMSILILPAPKTGVFLDMALYNKAVDKKKVLTGLETPEEQIAVFENLPVEVQVTLLKLTVDHHATLPKTIEEMIKAYLIRDLAKLEEIGERDMVKTPEGRRYSDLFKLRLIDERNVRMAQRISFAVQQNKTFVAVGAMHLPGDKGILRLLEQQGYQVSLIY